MMQAHGEEESLGHVYDQYEIAREEDKAVLKREYERRTRRNDSLRTVAESLLASNDTSKLGTVLYHVYRARRRTGEVVIDTAGCIMLTGKPDKYYPILTYDIIENIRLR